MISLLREWKPLLKWSILLYLFIFQPIVSKYYYLGIEVFVVLLFAVIHKNSFKKCVLAFKQELQLAAIICLYSLFLDLIHGGVVYSDRFLASFFQGFFVPFVIYFYLKKDRHLSSVPTVLYLVCFIACSITIAAILIPGVEQFVLNHATLDSREMFMERYTIGSYEHYRSYGLSESLNFTYAYVLSVIGVLCIDNKVNLFSVTLLVMVIVAIIFNARIAFVPLIVYFAFFILIKRKTRGSIYKLLFFAILALFLWRYIISTFPSLNNSWGLSFFTELVNYVSGEDAGTIGTLTNEMIVLPESLLSWLFGTGQSIYVGTHANSDVGYILQLNYGGLVLLFLVLLYFVLVSIRIKKVLSIRHWFVPVFITSIFILNFKGFYLSAIPGSRFLTFLYIYYILFSKVTMSHSSQVSSNLDKNENHFICGRV